MGSRGIAGYDDPERTPPPLSSLPTRFGRAFRDRLGKAFATVAPASGRALGRCIGVYAFYDYDGEPMYVGQTIESFATRVGRHLRGQRSGTVAYRIVDPLEVAEIELCPTENLRDTPTPELRRRIDELEYALYSRCLDRSRYGVTLNEKIPRATETVSLPASFRFCLVADGLRDGLEHPDVRIVRRAETLSALAGVAHDRGEVSAGLRRAIVVQQHDSQI